MKKNNSIKIDAVQRIALLVRTALLFRPLNSDYIVLISFKSAALSGCRLLAEFGPIIRK